MSDSNYKNFTVTTDARGVRKITLDVPDRPLNVLDRSVMVELEQIVTDLENSTDVKVVVIQSGKESGFLAGADVNAIAEIAAPTDALRLIEDGQLLFQRIEWLPMPKIVVIHGPCLGGGLELSLACTHRIARDNSSTQIGLPEIKLGVIPGWGGTQRLPKLVGLTNALSMIMQGKHLSARDALKIGLVDRAIAPEDWADEVDRFITDVLKGNYMLPPHSRRPLALRMIEGTKLGRTLILRAAKKKIASKKEQYPALESAIKAIAHSYKRGSDGFMVERTEFTSLLATPTCRHLLQLFFAREKARSLKTWSPDDIRVAHETPIRKVGVIGAGAMGAGIGQLAALRGFDVVLKEINEEAAQAGRDRIDELVGTLAKRKGWNDSKRDELMNKITVTCESESLAGADLMVEAIVERMDVKKSVFKELDALAKEDAILATNTSSLSVDEMATAVSRPGHFGGLHFFNPVHRMELVEVVRGEKTDSATVARLVAFVRALGKTPVVTADSPGFLVNRVLFPYLGESVLMVRDGYNIEKMDKQLRQFGMPMGPLELLDQVGLDVALHVAKSLSDVLSGVEPVVETLSEMVDDGKLGKKSNVGFYHYLKGKRGESTFDTDRSAAVTPASFQEEFPEDGMTAIQRRLVYPMLAEAIRCYEEKVVDEPWAIDLAMVLGTGFAPHRGGPLHVVDSIGSHRLLANMRRLKAMCGPRFTPPDLLAKHAETGETFFASEGASDQETPVSN
ncbi:MAG: multifunctional fatty acid oxidation complex subunit alpha [Pirellulaceae bacterium]|nr:multifunctional fatty acid oxidation complex subunit alpha [Pirellulaceae bacterium]